LKVATDGGSVDVVVVVAVGEDVVVVAPGEDVVVVARRDVEVVVAQSWHCESVAFVQLTGVVQLGTASHAGQVSGVTGVPGTR